LSHDNNTFIPASFSDKNSEQIKENMQNDSGIEKICEDGQITSIAI